MPPPFQSSQSSFIREPTSFPCLFFAIDILKNASFLLSLTSLVRFNLPQGLNLPHHIPTGPDNIPVFFLNGHMPFPHSINFLIPSEEVRKAENN